VKRFIKEGQALEADVYHAHEPASLYLAFCMARWNPGRVVFDSHESWLSGSYRDFWVKRICLPRLRYLITANPLTRGHLLARNPAMATKVVYNYPEKQVFHYQFDTQKFQQPVIAHEGILPFNRGLKLMVEALVQLTQIYPGVKLRLIGEVKGEEQTYLNHKIAKHNLYHNIILTGWVPYEKVPDYLKDAAIGLILKTPTPLNNIMGGPAIKLFNYMASGMAIVDAGLPESTRFLDDIRAGITLRDRAPQTLANALQYLLDRPDVMQQYAARGYEASKARTWEAEGKRLADFYEHLVLAPQSGLLIR
jgi:glycosyltransferase involved in cell wall biosynthesis